MYRKSSAEKPISHDHQLVLVVGALTVHNYYTAYRPHCLYYSTLYLELRWHSSRKRKTRTTHKMTSMFALDLQSKDRITDNVCKWMVKEIENDRPCARFVSCCSDHRADHDAGSVSTLNSRLLLSETTWCCVLQYMRRPCYFSVLDLPIPVVSFTFLNVMKALEMALLKLRPTARACFGLWPL